MSTYTSCILLMQNTVFVLSCTISPESYNSLIALMPVAEPSQCLMGALMRVVEPSQCLMPGPEPAQSISAGSITAIACTKYSHQLFMYATFLLIQHKTAYL